MAEVDLIAWATAEAQRLRAIPPPLTRAQGNQGQAEVRGALEFLRRNSAGSSLEEGATAALKAPWAGGVFEQVARCLEQWIDLTQIGLITQQPYEVRARLDAATDLMEQVQQLLEDMQVHPAAPIVLAGAALEEHLRSMIEAGRHPVVGRPGLNTYAAALKAAEVLDRQAVKDITSWAGLRNEAAHGHFDDLTRAGAQLMVAGINNFMQKRDA